MADATMVSAEGAISFGPFSLLPGQRLLLEGDKPVRLGSRALDILIALVDRPGELVGKAELMARVWRGTFVDEYAESENRSHIVRFQVDLRASARTFLAPILWLLGFPDQATHMADAAIADARAANHAMSLCHALAFGACPTALFAGDLARGEHYARLLIDEANRQGLARWHAFSRGYQGALLIKRGNIAGGLELLRAGSAELGGVRNPALYGLSHAGGPVAGWGDRRRAGDGR